MSDNDVEIPNDLAGWLESFPEQYRVSINGVLNALDEMKILKIPARELPVYAIVTLYQAFVAITWRGSDFLSGMLMALSTIYPEIKPHLVTEEEFYAILKSEAVRQHPTARDVGGAS